MLIFRALFSIIIAPITIFLNLFKHKDNLLEWHLTYGEFIVQIQTKYKEQNRRDDLLIASYILFLSRYFYVCDERQADVVRSILKQEVVYHSDNPKQLTEKIYNSIFSTLTSKEQEVVGMIYSTGVPPLSYRDKEDSEPYHPNAKYSFLVFDYKGTINENFHISHGPDIILLPVSIGILYEYVLDKLNDIGNRKKLDASILNLLEAHNHCDCRSLRVSKQLPVEVILENKINYKL